MTWNHERGLGPLVSTAKAYMTENPDVEIQWDVRTLQEFADYPIERLAETYDMIVIDHPFVGFGAKNGCLLPLDERLEADFLARQASQSVGKSHQSYFYDGHQWALAIDAACHVSAYRPDLLATSGAGIPQTWEEVLSLGHLARQKNQWITVPLIPVDSLMSLFTLCANMGESPCATKDYFVSRTIGRNALDLLRQIQLLSHPESLSWNPPKVLERMSSGDEIVYCPLLFGYSNYSRDGFREKLLRFTNIPSSGNGPVGGILGGTGLALSSRTPHSQIACQYAAYVAEAETQRRVYFDGGGQPGNRTAWIDTHTNKVAHNFFHDTIETLDKSYLRPRYRGYMKVQEHASFIVHDFLRENHDRNMTLETLDNLYRNSFTH